MASNIYQDYLGRPLKLGRDGKAVPYVEPPAKVPKPPKPAKATKKLRAPLPGDVLPAAIDENEEGGAKP